MSYSNDDNDFLIEEDDDKNTQEGFKKYNDKIKEIKKRQEDEAKNNNAKSNLTLDIKPTDTDVNLEELESRIRRINLEGLKWLGSENIDVAYGIKKIRIVCQLVDNLIDPDTICDEISKDGAVQSADVFAFQMA
jgi:Translation elongation factor EF-1beta